MSESSRGEAQPKSVNGKFAQRVKVTGPPKK